MATGGSDEASSVSFSRGNEECFMYECGVCKRGGTTSEAKSYCTSCPSYLCVRCELSHRGIPLTMDHKIITGASFPPAGSSNLNPALPILYCDEHKTMTLSYYCKSHERVICGACKLNNHRLCVTTSVTEQVRLVKVEDNLDETMKCMKTLKTEYENVVISRQGDKQDVITHLQNCHQHMQKVRKDMTDTLIKLEKKFMVEIKILEIDLKKEMDDHLNISNDALVHINDEIKVLGDCQKTKDDETMFVGTKKANIIKTKCEGTLKNMTMEMQRVKLRFQPNGIVNDVLNQALSIGTVVVDRQPLYPRPVYQNPAPAPASTPAPAPAPTPVRSKTIYDRKSKPTYGEIVKPHVFQSVRQAPAPDPAPTPVRSKNTFQSVQQAPTLTSSVVYKRGVPVASRHVLGCTFMPSGHLVIGCGTDGLQLLDAVFEPKVHISDFSLRVSAINDKEVMVTQGDMKQLIRVKIYPAMKVEKTIKTGRTCTGVDVHGEEIFVSCHDNPGNGEILVMDMDGVIKRKLGYVRSSIPFISKNIFVKPNCVKVNKLGTRVYVSDEDSGAVTCMDKQGNVVYSFFDHNLKTPTGLYVGHGDSLLVCGHGSHDVVKVKADGTRDKAVLTRKDGINYPLSISYRPDDSCLVVGSGIEDKKKSMMSFIIEKF